MAKPKFTKDMLLRGLERFPAIEGVADWLGVHRTTVWRKMQQWNIEKRHVKAHFTAPNEPVNESKLPPVAEHPQEIDAKPIAPKSERRFNISDYTGPDRGNVRPSFSAPDSLLARYRKLRGC